MIVSFFGSLGKLVLIFFIICLSVWLVFRLFGKFIFRVLMKRFSRKMNQQFQESGRSRSTAQEGKTTIAFDPGRSSERKDNIGEYIDYEEID